MKCPKCGAEMVKARKSEVWLCTECGARGRFHVDLDPVDNQIPVTYWPSYPVFPGWHDDRPWLERITSWVATNAETAVTP